MPLVEQCEENVVANHSQLPAVDEKDFFSGIRVMAASDKVGSQYLRRDFWRDSRHFLEDFVICILSTVASRSVIGQGMSCFYPAIVVGGNNVALFQLFNKLLDGLLEKNWTRGSEIEACRAEYQSFVQEQRQLERSSMRSCFDVVDVLSFCSAQAGYRAHQHKYQICIPSNQTWLSREACLAQVIMLFHVFQLTTLLIRGPETRGENFFVRRDRVVIKKTVVLGFLLCVQDFVRTPHFTHRSFFSESGLTMLSESVSIADRITSSPVYAP